MITVFISSCVQGDLYDEFYEEDGGLFTRKKKGKDVMPIPYTLQQVVEAEYWMDNHQWTSSENECFALALCNWNHSLKMKDVRRALARDIFGNCMEYGILYMRYVVYYGGLPTGDNIDYETSIINEIAGASICWKKGDSKDPIDILRNNPGCIVGAELQANTGSLGHHFGTLDRIEFVYPNIYKIWLIDQKNYGTFVYKSEIESIYN